ncbi:hypothetical protein BH09BAC4_BH09BAC4_20700 [soil metagenome]
MDNHPALPTSFVGTTNRFYVLRNEGLNNPAIPKMYMMYTSVEAYNNREETPSLVLAEKVLDDFNYEVEISLTSLTTTIASNEKDQDKANSCLISPIQVWQKRFKQQKENRNHEV